jgi:hypothetical protein
MEYLEVNDPVVAAEKFAVLMVEEGANPMELQKFIKKIMERNK